MVRKKRGLKKRKVTITRRIATYRTVKQVVTKSLAEPIYERIGDRIRFFRKQSGWTQEELSRVVGFSRASIANMECGRQRIYIHDLIAFAKVFGIPNFKLLSTAGVK